MVGRRSNSASTSVLCLKKFKVLGAGKLSHIWTKQTNKQWKKGWTQDYLDLQVKGCFTIAEFLLAYLAPTLAQTSLRCNSKKNYLLNSIITTFPWRFLCEVSEKLGKKGSFVSPHCVIPMKLFSGSYNPLSRFLIVIFLWSIFLSFIFRLQPTVRTIAFFKGVRHRQNVSLRKECGFRC